MKITIAGAGAMGSRLAIALAEKGQDVQVVDSWQEHVDAIRGRGLIADCEGQEKIVRLPAYHMNSIPKELSADLIIVLTKAMQLDGMLNKIQTMIHSDTQVLCLLNGIGHEEVIEKYVARENILLGNTMWTAGMEGPGRVKLFGDGFIVMKNLVDQEKAVEKAHEVAKILSDAGLNASYSQDILYAIYKKACVNGTMNGLCTLLSSNMADFGQTRASHDILTAIVSEFAAVAEVEGVHLEVADIVKYIEESCYNRETIGLHHPSMYQDLIINKRSTEIDYINGAVVRKGKRYGIATPYCQFLTQLIHSKEDLLDAK
ncbi:2-dehydropantoate 2-reductase [Arcanobacterium canis]|uniref:2-dehydropantoate 2-reductase n=1 Tax=Arcanobacterium canis TaxID=999183 RepID=A0ABY8FYA5_9ACTO|nr:2-dehydropantoate 2-reductase [Arcanobacterium canis]WFM83479.1 2-dehydropantoate 2-reductase [Arcanobacterium canis]